jgi:hypothetical protein
MQRHPTPNVYTWRWQLLLLLLPLLQWTAGNHTACCVRASPARYVYAAMFINDGGSSCCCCCLCCSGQLATTLHVACAPHLPDMRML